MSQRPKIAKDVRDVVRLRANGLCEYCHAAECWQYVEFTIDHIVPRAYGGATNLDNLAFVCFACNRRKWDKLQGNDPQTGQTARLFHPRLDIWNEHFAWSVNGLDLVGRSTVGSTTILLLELNRERLRLIRAADVHVGRHPPHDDYRLRM